MSGQSFDENQVYELTLDGYSRENQSDATYEYIAHAIPGTALATAAWRAQRITIATGSRVFADGGEFTQVGTDLTALSYAI